MRELTFYKSQILLALITLYLYFVLLLTPDYFVDFNVQYVLFHISFFVNLLVLKL